MKKLYTLYKSTNPLKKYDVFIISSKGRTKKVSFGAKNYEDYTMHKDKQRRTNYRNRHRNDKINNPEYAGFWSWWVLWGDSTSIKKNLIIALRKIKK